MAKVKVSVLVRDETVRLTQRSLSELFAVGVPAITNHLKNIFDSGELERVVVISNLETTATDGKNYKTQWYNFSRRSQLAEQREARVGAIARFLATVH